jgi:hypothetical protein
MAGHEFQLKPGILWERVGPDVVVLNPKDMSVHLLTGNRSEAFLSIALSDPASTKPTFPSELEEMGLISPRKMSPVLSRRKALAGLITAGGLVFSLPGIASASSGLIILTGSDIQHLEVEWRIVPSDEIAVLVFFGSPNLPVSVRNLFVTDEEWAVVLDPYLNSNNEMVTAPTLLGSRQGTNDFLLLNARQAGALLTPKTGINLQGFLSRGNVRIGPLTFPPEPPASP